MAYKGYTDAQREATRKYQATLKNLSVRMQPEQYEYYKRAAEHFDLPIRQFVLLSMDEYIENHSL